jgi:DNA-binding transcriptional ArsR family regulator
MVDEKTLEMARRQAAICRLFASERRILILWTLVEQEKSVSDIATAVQASMQNTSQHLHLMKEKGILQSHRDGQTIYYRIADDENTQLCQLLIEKHKKTIKWQP